VLKVRLYRYGPKAVSFAPRELVRRKMRIFHMLE
jgi:hypothetical protein